MIELLILALATYGTSKLVAEYDGFADVFYKLRRKRWLSMLTCTVCTSVYVAAAFSIVWALGHAFWLTPLAAVVIVIILEEKL